MDLREQLQSSLGHIYFVERELGGGGMSRVFVATDSALGRSVVIKVLPPDTAGQLSIDRFQREITVAARLQHPHIVPLFNAGDAGGLLYYTMPFVEGESLRDRLRREPRLPVVDVRSIVRDVLSALSYAHQRGVVHRDIKPENILLSQGGALVADFGIAKAVDDAMRSRSERGDAAPPELTLTGVTLGTPAYMAPEQITADREIDGRVDLYALGCVAFEMLAGEHVFPARPPQSQIVAHATEVPPSVRSKRGDADEQLVRLVDRCLSKAAADRPSADEALKLLELPERAGPLFLTRRRALAGAGILAVVLLTIGAYAAIPTQMLASARTLITRRPSVLRVNRVVVTPFENQTGDARLDALGAMVADYLGEGLSRIGRLEVLDARTTYIAGQVVNRIPRVFRPGNDQRAIAEETGAKVVVAGSVYRTGDSLSLRARIVDGATGALLQALPAVATPLKNPSNGIEALISRVVATLQVATDTAVSVMPGIYSPPPTVDAYDEMRQGMEWYFKRDHAQTTLHLKRAISMDSTYETPRVMLALVSLQWSDPRVADSATTAAEHLARRATPAELSLLKYVRACLSGDVDGAVAASQSFMTLQPGSMEAPLLAANVALSARRPQLAMQALERTDPDHGLNLAGSYYWEFKSEAARQLGRLSESIDIAREGLRRFPDEFESVFTLAMPLTASGRMQDLHDLLKKTRPQWASWTAAELVVPGLVIGGRSSDARAFAQEWLQRTEHDSIARLSEAEDRGLLLLENERWNDLEAFTRRWTVPSSVDYAHLTMTALRAVALVHLGRAAEAAAIDSALDRPKTTPMRGRYIYARAQIAAHRGDRDRAVGLVEAALAAGYGLEFYSTGIWHDPLVMGLAGSRRFVALVKAGA